MTTRLRSDLVNVFFFKVIWPLALLEMARREYWASSSSSLILLAIFLVATWFGASLAILEVGGGGIRYRRLFRWTLIHEDEIVSARTVWGGFIGAIRLKRRMFPWGSLYFVLDASSNSNPFRRSESALLRRLSGASVPEGRNAKTSDRPAAGGWKRRVAVAAAGGAVLNSAVRFIPPGWVAGLQLPQPDQVQSPLIRIQWQVVRLFASPEVVLLLSVVFVLFTVVRCRRPDAWITAFLASSGVTRLVWLLVDSIRAM